MWTNVTFATGYNISMSYNGNKIIEEKVLNFVGFVCSNQYPINDGYWYELIE